MRRLPVGGKAVVAFEERVLLQQEVGVHALHERARPQPSEVEHFGFGLPTRNVGGRPAVGPGARARRSAHASAPDAAPRRIPRSPDVVDLDTQPWCLVRLGTCFGECPRSGRIA